MSDVSGPLAGLEPKPKKFRINRKKIGLTYSCPKNAPDNPIESKEELLEFLELKAGRCQYIVAKELHESGKKHYHVWANFDDVVDTTNQLFFDFKGVHPNIIKPGNGWMAYCRKDKEFITNVEKNPFTEALEQPSVTEAVDFLWKKRPQCMALNGDRIEKNIAKRMKKDKPKHSDHKSYQWLPLQNIKSTLLIGESGIGKTQYALWSKHFTSPLVVSHMDQLREFDPTIHDGIIFDDMDFKHLPREAQIHLLDWDVDRAIHARYNVATIPAHTKKIFTANKFPFNRDDKAIDRRLTVVELSPQP